MFLNLLKILIGPGQTNNFFNQKKLCSSLLRVIVVLVLGRPISWPEGGEESLNAIWVLMLTFIRSFLIIVMDLLSSSMVVSSCSSLVFLPLSIPCKIKKRYCFLCLFKVMFSLRSHPETPIKHLQICLLYAIDKFLYSIPMHISRLLYMHIYFCTHTSTPIHILHTYIPL